MMVGCRQGGVGAPWDAARAQGGLPVPLLPRWQAGSSSIQKPAARSCPLSLLATAATMGPCADAQTHRYRSQSAAAFISPGTCFGADAAGAAGGLLAPPAAAATACLLNGVLILARREGHGKTG
jgi:hypothetical protein